MNPPRPRSTERSLFRFCPYCGAPLSRRPQAPSGSDSTGEPRGEAPLRPTCARCGYIQWRNPVVGVAAVLWEDDIVRALGAEAVRGGLLDPTLGSPGAAGRVLLVRRAASYKGMWCIPCGYVEFDEDFREALVREIEEETGLRVRAGSIVAVHSNFHEPDRQSVGLWLAATPLGGRLRAGDDVDAIGFFPPGEPGVPLAFPTDAQVLADLRRLPSP